MMLCHLESHDTYRGAVYYKKDIIEACGEWRELSCDLYVAILWDEMWVEVVFYEQESADTVKKVLYTQGLSGGTMETRYMKSAWWGGDDKGHMMFCTDDVRLMMDVVDEYFE